MGIETLFYILMAIIFAWTLMFGFNKIFDTQDILSEQERVELMRDLENSFAYCDDPLNKGSLKNFEIKNSLFNGVCVLGSDFDSSDPKYGDYDDWVEIKNANEDVIVLKTSFTKSGEEYELRDYVIIDSFDLDISPSKRTICWFDKENDGIVLVPIRCE